MDRVALGCDVTREELREELAPVIDELRALRRVFDGPAAAEAPIEQGCLHPEERRKSLTAATGPIEWVCGVDGCGYHHTEPRE